MKEHTVFIQPIALSITYKIGKTQNEQFSIIDSSGENDLWFHANNESSCHVSCEIPQDIKKEQLRYLVKMGALLCKQNTNKLKSQKNVEIMYARIKDINKTNIAGRVHAINTKLISV
jgi:hypothetical protein